MVKLKDPDVFGTRSLCWRHVTV